MNLVLEITILILILLIVSLISWRMGWGMGAHYALKGREKILCSLARDDHTVTFKWADFNSRYVLFDGIGGKKYNIVRSCIILQLLSRDSFLHTSRLTATLDYNYDNPFPNNYEIKTTSSETPK